MKTILLQVVVFAGAIFLTDLSSEETWQNLYAPVIAGFAVFSLLITLSLRANGLHGGSGSESGYFGGSDGDGGGGGGGGGGE